MPDIADRYRKNADAFAAKVAHVPPDRWSSPTPCEDWDARALVRHVIDSQAQFLGFVGRTMADPPSSDDDPSAAWDAVRTAIQADLDDPARAGAEFEGFAGRTTFAAAVDRFLSSDLVIHGWDLARAAGLDETIDPSEVDRGLVDYGAFGEMLRGPGVCGPAIDPAPDADAQTRLLNFLGRRA